jgi:hypothetical protein
MEKSEINPCSSRHQILNKGATNIPCTKDHLFNKWCWENWISTCRRLRLDLYLSSCIKINSKWIKDLNVKPETFNLLWENT